jgi:two-component system CheB/CheR fusion protein
MGGAIKVVSEIGVGSTFSFDLNLMEPQTSLLILPEATLEILPAIAISTPPQTKRILEPATPEQMSLDQASIVNKVKLAATLPLSILVADDVKYNQILLQKFLQRLGYEPDIVSNGLEVLAQMRQKHYDAILMDIQMNDMDGIETTRQILAEWDQKDRPYIIAVTANASQKDRDTYLAVGMDEYMSKPIDFAQLEKILLHVCSRMK